MKPEQDILTQIGHRDGMKVPEGYFADFAARMAENLPSTSFEKSQSMPISIKKHSIWSRVKPYVYMAAMFMGVWCMLKLFTMITSPTDNAWEPSPIMAEALGNEMFVNDYIIDDLDQWDIIDDMMDDGVEPELINTDLDSEDDFIEQ